MNQSSVHWLFLFVGQGSHIFDPVVLIRPLLFRFAIQRNLRSMQQHSTTSSKTPNTLTCNKRKKKKIKRNKKWRRRTRVRDGMARVHLHRQYSCVQHLSAPGPPAFFFRVALLDFSIPPLPRERSIGLSDLTFRPHPQRPSRCNSIRWNTQTFPFDVSTFSSSSPNRVLQLLTN